MFSTLTTVIFPSHRVRKKKMYWIWNKRGNLQTVTCTALVVAAESANKQTPPPDGLPDAPISYILVLDPL